MNEFSLDYWGIAWRANNIVQEIEKIQSRENYNPSFVKHELEIVENFQKVLSPGITYNLTSYSNFFPCSTIEEMKKRDSELEHCTKTLNTLMKLSNLELASEEELETAKFFLRHIVNEGQSLQNYANTKFL